MKKIIDLCDPQSEAGLLSILIFGESKNALDCAMEKIEPSDFGLPKTRKIFEAISLLYEEEKTVNLIFVVDVLRKTGKIDDVGGVTWIVNNIPAYTNSISLEKFIDVILDYSKRRKVREIANRISQASINFSVDISDAIDRIEEELLHVRDKEVKKNIKTAAEVVGKFVSDLQKKKESRDIYDGIPAGFDELDKKTYGFRKSEMIVIGARPSIGKTAFAMNIANHMALNLKKSVGIFSLEMSSEQLLYRIASIRSGIDGRKIKNPNLLTAANWNRLGDVLSEMKNAKIFFNDCSSMKLPELKKQARILKREHDVDVIIIDYLGLILPDDPKIPRWEQMSNVSRSIKALSRELDIPIIILSQLRRDAEGKEPTLADLRETGAIEQDADVVMLLHRDRVKDSNNIPTKLILAKQRNGEIGTCNLRFIPNCASFENLESA